MSRDATIYERLAAEAHSWGYAAVSGPAVHAWRKRGLLPAPIVRHDGFGGSRSEIPAELLDQLRALCRWRYDEPQRDLAVVGAMLWLDGFAIEPGHLRGVLRGAVGYLDRELRRQGGRAKVRDDGDPHADLDAVAVRFARTDAAHVFGTTSKDEDQIANGALELMSGLTGRTDRPDADALEDLALSMGLGAAMTDAPIGATPWLTGGTPGQHLADAAAALSVDGVRARIDVITDEGFEHLRLLTIRMIAAMLPTTDYVRLVMAPGQFGLGALQVADFTSSLAKLTMIQVCLVAPDTVEQATTAFEAEVVELESLVTLGRLFLERHPEMQRDAAARGLEAVVRDFNELANGPHSE